jgi:nitrogen fixation protein NifB
MNKELQNEEVYIEEKRISERPDFQNHPCFSMAARHTTGRIHLPVAPKCNIQCNFCNRKYDCMNESRPGVTSSILTPAQSVLYLDAVLKKIPAISVIGIAGPGDPFANAEETLDTLDKINTRYPDKLLCLASNGLEISPYIDTIAALNVSHVTITVNAVNPDIGAQIYRWVRKDKQVYQGTDAAKLLLESQTEAIRRLHEKHITVKINTVIIPGINDTHAVEIAGYCKNLGADIQNCIPLVPVKDTVFETIETPSSSDMQNIRKMAGEQLPQMCHCARCRADAVGMLGEENNTEITQLLTACSLPHPSENRPYIAVATREGIFVNEHLGEADFLWIFGFDETTARLHLIEKRKTPLPGDGSQRWESLAATIQDCYAVLSSGCGQAPKTILTQHNIPVFVMEGLLPDGALPLYQGKEIPSIVQHPAGTCSMGKGCGGNGAGC